MKRLFRLFTILCIIVIGIVVYQYYFQNRNTLSGHRVVLCIPVYGQSLALGQEAVRITNFDSLKIKNNGRIVTAELDYSFGYIDDFLSRQRFKKLIHYDTRAFELSSYKMAEKLVSQLGEDTIICIFPGGRGMSRIKSINKGTSPYRKFLYELQLAYKEAKKNDRFVLIRCGEGKTGLVMSGIFDSNPYQAGDWSGKGRKVFYMDMTPNFIADPEEAEIITTKQLQEAIPSFDWSGGHSGRLLTEEQARQLEDLLAPYLSQFVNNVDEETINGFSLPDGSNL